MFVLRPTCRLCCRIRCFSTAVAGTTAAGATTIRFTTISATGSRSIGKVETDTLGTRHQRTGSGGTVGILGVVGQEADGKGKLGRQILFPAPPHLYRWTSSPYGKSRSRRALHFPMPADAVQTLSPGYQACSSRHPWIETSKRLSLWRVGRLTHWPCKSHGDEIISFVLVLQN